jgi:hypothetical protein
LFGLLFVAADAGKFASLCSHRDAGPDDDETGSARFDTCLTVATAANIKAAQNAPISAENIKRESITRSNSLPRKPN